jgi:Uma2 family endonuclease
MGMPDLAPWSRAQVLSLPADGKRYELIDGELLVTPTPRLDHQRVVRALNRLLDAHCLAHRLGDVFELPADLEVEPGQLTSPDLFVLPLGAAFHRWEEAPRPLLVIEVLSPSTARYDRGLKRRFYQRAGVPEYWIVDADARLIERWRPDDERPEVIGETLTWSPRLDGAVLTIDVRRLFVEELEY